MTCTITGCDKQISVVKAALCKTHYNQTRPNRHRKVEKACDMCGNVTLKDKRAQRYAGTYCSTKCRDDAIRTQWPTCRLPDDHWGRWYGKTSKWRAVEKRAAFFANACDDCGDSFIDIAHGVPSAYCSDRCQKRVSRRRRRAREYNAPGEYTFTQVMRQYAKQGNVCAYCRRPASGLPDPEHVTPLSRGGRNDMSNIVASCRSCNTDKCDLTLDEWAADRSRRGLEPVDTSLHGTAYLHLMRTTPTASAWRDKPSNITSKVAA